MAQPKTRRGSKPAGSRSDGSAAASAAGALWGGGGENTAFPEASAEVKAGTLSSPGEGYDPRAATSARGVLTPSLQAAYTQGPFKDLNWFGKMTHQPDQADAWKMSQATADAASARALADNPQLLEQGNVAHVALQHQLEVQRQNDLNQLLLQNARLKGPNAMPESAASVLDLGNQYQQIGLPAARNLRDAALAAAPGVPENTLLAQGRENSYNRLSATLNNQQNAVRIDPQNSQLVLNSEKAHLLQPALNTDASTLENKKRIAEGVWDGVQIVKTPTGDMFLNYPGAKGLIGETVAGTPAQKNQPFQDANGQWGLRNVPAVPPSFSSGLRSADGKVSFVPSAGLGERTLSPELFGNYGLQPSGAPPATPAAARQAFDPNVWGTEVDPNAGKQPEVTKWKPVPQRQQAGPALQPTIAPPASPSAMMQQGLGSIATGGKNWLQGLWNRQMGGAQPAAASAPDPMLDPDQAALLDAEAERKRRSLWMTPSLSPYFQ